MIMETRKSSPIFWVFVILYKKVKLVLMVSSYILIGDSICDFCI